MRLSIAVIVMFATLASTCRIPQHESHIDTEKYIQECGDELKIPASELYKYKTLSEVPEGHIGQCFTKCMFVKIRIFDKDSNFKFETIFKSLSKLRPPVEDVDFLPMVEQCTKEVDQIENLCERVYRGIKCFDSETFKNRKTQLSSKNFK